MDLKGTTGFHIFEDGFENYFFEATLFVFKLVNLCVRAMVLPVKYDK